MAQILADSHPAHVIYCDKSHTPEFIAGPSPEWWCEVCYRRTRQKFTIKGQDPRLYRVACCPAHALDLHYMAGAVGELILQNPPRLYSIINTNYGEAVVVGHRPSILSNGFLARFSYRRYDLSQEVD
jgi:hypothetical protein